MALDHSRLGLENKFWGNKSGRIFLRLTGLLNKFLPANLGILYLEDWTGLDWTGLLKRELVKRGLVKRGLVKRGLVKRGLVKRGLVKRGLVKRGLVKRGLVKRKKNVGFY